MAGPVSLNVISTPPIGQTEFPPDLERWFTNIVDIINNNFGLLNKTFANLITASGIDVGGSGAGPISVTVTGLTASGFVNVTLISSSNPVTIQTVTPGLNAFDITFSADPGASAIIVYQAFTAKPQ